jgi:hypothetical protein
MAILLGAFIIQGIVPGPDLLNPAKHLTLTFSFVWTIVITNIITVAICFLFLNQLAKITYVKGAYLIPFLLLLVYLGGFAVKNSFGDMMLVLIFGALGWLMVKFDWQRPPLLLGLVLGGIAENNLFIASRIYGAGWLLHPAVLVIAFITIAGLLYPVLKSRRRRLREAKHQPEADESATSLKVRLVPAPIRVARASFAFFILAVLSYVAYEAHFGFGAWEPRAALFPLVIGTPTLLLAAYIFVRECLRSTEAVKAEEHGFEPALEIDPLLARQRTLAIGAWIVGFFVAIWLLGFTAAAAVATFVYLKLGAKEQWVPSAALTLVAWLFFYGLFDYALQLPFPDGAVLDWMHIDIPAAANLFASG